MVILFHTFCTPQHFANTNVSEHLNGTHSSTVIGLQICYFFLDLSLLTGITCCQYLLLAAHLLSLFGHFSSHWSFLIVLVISCYVSHCVSYPLLCLHSCCVPHLLSHFSSLIASLISLCSSLLNVIQLLVVILLSCLYFVKGSRIKNRQSKFCCHM